MKSILKITFFSVSILLLAALGCKKKDDATPATSNSSFDQTGMLTNIGSNIIVPAYRSLNSSTLAFDSAVTAFTANANDTTLSALQTAFKNMYKAWQSCSEFEFGPADQQNLSGNLNTFPTDTNQINSNISSGSYNLSTLTNVAAKGLPAFDFLLFGTGQDNNAILARYTTSSDASARKQYLTALSTDMKTYVTSVSNSWTSGGYLNTFISATGTNAGSSIGLLTNSSDYDLEILKNDKLGIPLGKQSMGTIYPTKVEAYYSGISSQLALLQLETIQNIYLGKSAQGDGLGFDDYLVSINAQYNNGKLNDTIKNEFTTAVSKLQAVPDPLSSTVQNNPAPANAAYVEVQKLVVLLKTDMPSAMGVLITYEDNDGD